MLGSQASRTSASAGPAAQPAQPSATRSATSDPVARIRDLGQAVGNRRIGGLLNAAGAQDVRGPAVPSGSASTRTQGPTSHEETEAQQAATSTGGHVRLQPHLGIRTPWIGGGHQLPAPQRARLEQGLDLDLTNVRTFEGAEAHRITDRRNARAVTFGPHVFLGAGERTDDAALMTHEIAHAAQQGDGGSAPHMATLRSGKPPGEFDFETKVKRIDALLSYSIVDWAITDEEALEALELLESMGHVERASAMSHVDVGRLRDNLPGTQIKRLEILVSETQPEVADTRRLQSLVAYGLFDWVITDAEATEALGILEKLTPTQRMHALMTIDRRRLYENLPDDDQKARLAELWTQAHQDWSRARQQHDPLSAGDRVRIQVWNAIGQQEERAFGFTPEYIVSERTTIELPMIGVIDVRGLRPSDIEARIASRLREGILLAPIVSVEVVRRGGESFEARDLEASEEPLPRDTALEPGDTLELRILDTGSWTEESDLSGNFQVDRAGRMSLEHFGLVDVAGMTAASLEVHLAGLLQGWFRQPPTIWLWFTSHRGKISRPAAASRPRPNRRSADVAAERERELALVPKRLEVDVYLEFVRAKQREIADPKLSARDRDVASEALTQFLGWLDANRDDARLAATSPWEVWSRIHTRLWVAAVKRDTERSVLKRSEEEREKQHSAAVQAKLDEYWKWARWRWRNAAKVFSNAGPAYLVTEHPMREVGMDFVTSAVLSWAYANTDDPDFLKRNPEEVRNYLEARDPHVGAMTQLAETAPPRVEYFPEFDRTRYTLGEVATETLFGFIPILGDAGDAVSAISGVSLTGHELDTGDRLLSGFAAVIPFVSGTMLRGGRKVPEVVEHLAAASGRHADEIYAVFRVAAHLDPHDVKDLERIIATVKSGKRLPAAELQILDNIALKLKGPLEEAASVIAKGRSIPIGQLRADIVAGTKFIPGTVEHKAQRWIEYQFRHPDRFKTITGEVDPKWSRQYDQILANNKAGSAFEREALGKLGHDKNTAMMMPGEGSKLSGFIPDAVGGKPAQLVWGQPYRFTEIKGWQDMSKTGNLSAMIEYVRDVGGHLEVVFRSAKHPEGATKLSGPLQAALDELMAAGKATVVRLP